MNDSFAVRRIERVRDVNCDVKKPRDRERTSGDQVIQRAALEQLHHNEVLALELINFVNRTDMRMVERRRGPCFALESLQRLRIILGLLRKKFQGNLAAEANVFALVDYAHSSAAEPAENAVMGDFVGNHCHVAGPRS